jgi:hypothetical protein
LTTETISTPATDRASSQPPTREEASAIIEHSIGVILRCSPERQQKFLADLRADSPSLAVMADAYERIIRRHQQGTEVAA